jgi:hypothetical protein
MGGPGLRLEPNGWNASGYGWFYGDYATRRWIWHVSHAWQYVWEASTPESAWIWDAATKSWWWSARGVYPWLYDYADGKWYRYESGPAPQRRFYDWEEGALVDEAALSRVGRSRLAMWPFGVQDFLFPIHNMIDLKLLREQPSL